MQSGAIRRRHRLLIGAGIMFGLAAGVLLPFDGIFASVFCGMGLLLHRIC